MYRVKFGSFFLSTIILATMLSPIAGSSAWGQSLGAVSGTVTDPSGAIVAGATVTARNLATALERSTVTGDTGIYQIVSLPLGTYQVEVKAQGFKTKLITNLQVQVDQISTLNVQLEIGGVSENVVVEAEPPAIETATISVGQVIDDRTVQEIPLNGRHFVDLGLLLTGSVVQPQAGFLTAPLRGQGAFAFNTAGNREDTVNFQINGINLNDMSQNQITFQPSINTVSEFKSSNSTFSAEYGRNSGAIVNIATRSGSNQVHGEAFEFLRNDALDAKNFFDNPNLSIPPFKRNQFGAAFGGPVWLGPLYNGKDRTFFFFSYEGLRQRQRVPFNTVVPTAAQRDSVTDPVAKNLLQFIPAANVSGSDSRFAGSGSAPVNIDQWTVDISHKLTGRDVIHSYYAIQRDLRQEPSLQGNNVPNFGDTRQARRQVFTLTETRDFGAAMVNDARFGFNRIHITFQPNAQLNPSSLGINNGITADLGLPQISIQGSANFGGPAGFPQGRADTVLVWSDTLSFLKGRHSLKVGGEIRRFENNNFSQDVGSMNFTTFANFAAGHVDSFQITLGGAQSGIRTTGAGLFIQDNYKLRSNFTLEMGLRWDANTAPTEVNGKMVLFNPATASLVRVGTNGIDQAYDSNLRNFGPRFGFAWDPFSDGKTSIRGGYGLYYDQPVTNSVSGLTTNPPFAVPSTATPTPSTPVLISNPLANSQSTPTLAPNNISQDFTNAYVQSWNLNVQREIAKDLALQVGYFGSKGTHLRNLRNLNQLVSGVRPYPAFGNIYTIASIGNSSYNGLWVSADKRFSRGLQFNASYAYSHSIDYNSLNTQARNTIAQDSFNIFNERGSSDFDARHNFHISYIYDLPFRGGALIEGWQLSGITTFQTGNPFTVYALGAGPTGLATRRANIVGDPTLPNPDPSKWFNTAAFCAPGTAGCSGPAVFGNVGRNTLVGPGFSNFDISIMKTTRIRESLKVQFRTEFFDAFNHPNFGQPYQIPSQPGPQVGTATFGQIQSTRFNPGDSGSARQVQFAMKFLF